MIPGRSFLSCIFGFFAFFASFPVWGDCPTGVAALSKNDYAAAWTQFTASASQGDRCSQFNLGSMYANGQGVPVNLVESYLWLDLAARSWSGSHQQDAAKARDLVAQHLTPSDLAAAQDRVTKWLAAHQK